MNYAWAIGLGCHDKNLITVHYIADETANWISLTSCLNSEICLMKCPVNDEIMNYPTRIIITVALKNDCPKKIEITWMNPWFFFMTKNTCNPIGLKIIIIIIYNFFDL